MLDLESLTGQDIEAGDIFRKDGQFHAKWVLVDVDEHELDREGMEQDRHQSEEETQDSDGEDSDDSVDHD